MGLTYMLNVYLKPWFLAHEKKNVLIYSQMRFQLYQVHIMTDIGLKSGNKSINLRDLKVTLKLKLQT